MDIHQPGCLCGCLPAPLTTAQLIAAAAPESKQCIVNVLRFTTGKVPDPSLVDALLRAALEPLTKLLDDRDEYLAKEKH